ncbi:NUDIX hydrolase, partial [candidate division KSB1 bacterium]|nr:NUDIX hydrolase [candidate division KSB1 bacterium]
MKKIEEVVVHKEQLYKGNYLSFERWEVALPDDRHAMRDIVVPRDAVAILALDSEKNVHFVRHSRPAVNETLIEIPAGIIEPSEAPEETARRELLEEIGIRAGKLKKLVSYYHAEGYSTGVITIFLATELEVQSDFQPDQEEFL